MKGKNENWIGFSGEKKEKQKTKTKTKRTNIIRSTPLSFISLFQIIHLYSIILELPDSCFKWKI